MSTKTLHLRPRVVVALQPREFDVFFEPAAQSRFAMKELFGDIHFHDPLADNAGWRESLFRHDPEVIVSGWSTKTLPEDLPGLRYICHVGGSVRNVVPRALIERGVAVTNWGRSVAETVAEGALMLALSGLRRSHHFAHLMHQEQGWAYASGSGTRSLFDRRVGIHGFGAVAQELVPLLRHFRAKIQVHASGVPALEFDRFELKHCSSLEELFRTSDILFELESLTVGTHGIVTRELLELLPPEAVFVNAARGGIVDEEAIAQLAAQRRIRAALDVYTAEPLATDSPLRLNSEVVLFPHLCGPTEDRLRVCGQFALANLRRYREGESLAALITAEIYDRST